MTQRRALACVVGGLEYVQPLGFARVPVAVMARPDTVVGFSRYVRARVPWADPVTEPDRFIARLVAFARRQPVPPVLLPGGDWDLLAASRGRDRLARHMRLLLPPADLVEDLVDKTRFVRLAERLALPVPRTVPLSPGGGADPRSLELDFPVVVKPLTRHDPTWAEVAGESKVLLCPSRADLLALWPRLARLGLDYVAQEWIPGPETCIESYHVYADASGAIVAEFTGRKIRTVPPELGHSTAVEISDAADVRGAGRRCVERLGLVGVAKLDFKRGPDGRLHLLEVNPRFSLWHLPGARAGVNIPALYYADLSGGERPPVGHARPGVAWCDPLVDVKAAAANGVPLRRWLRWVWTCETKSSFNLNDPLPSLVGSWRHGARLVGRLLRRRAGSGPASEASA